MNEKPSMIKENIGIVLFSIMIISFASIFLFSCQSSEANKWIPPKFIKEWEIKEIKPGLPHQIISVAANKNGLFALVKAVEITYSPPRWTKKLTEMTKKEKEAFVIQIIMGRLFSGTAVTNMADEEKDQLINLLINYFIPPRNAKKMKKEEKEEIIKLLLKLKEEKEPERNRGTFKKILEKEGPDKFIDGIAEDIRTSIREEINHLRIQHYDFEGNFIKQFPEEGMLLKDPIKILLDNSGNVFTADYKANEVMNFSPGGILKKKWKMLPTEPIGEGDIFRGVAMAPNDCVLTIGEGDVIMTPGLYEYDTNGRLIKRQGLASMIKGYTKLFKDALIPSLMKIERIGDMVADTTGNVYLLKYKNITEDPMVVKLTPSWKEEREFRVILKEGFETPRIKVYEKYFKGFDSTQWNWIETGPGFYFPSSIFIDGEYLYVTFLGLKPFGVIDAIIYHRKGKIAGYWKQESRSYMDWYKSLSSDIEVIDMKLSAAGYGASIFLGRTMTIRTGAFYSKNVIQKFNK